MTIVTVFLGTEPEASIVRAYLEENGIKTTVEGANIATMAPHLAIPAGAGSVKVVVLQDDEALAQDLIAQKQKP